MDHILLHPTYFPSISHFVGLIQANHITFEIEDNFQKQTNRNRMYIASANGLQMLNIPIKHTKENTHQKFKDIQIEHAFGWQKQHLKSLEAAYRSSPYFEYFEDDIRPIFEGKPTYMMDLNFKIYDILLDCLGLDLPYSKTSEYQNENSELIDLRSLADGKNDHQSFDPYTQVFGEKHAFLNNLSILDLLFNEGRKAVDYLKAQTLVIK